jgi:glutathione S-transferase
MLRASPSARSGAVCRTRRVAMQASASAASGSAQPHRLHYFAGRGRAEQARWVLAATETRFVNAVLRSAAEFAALDDSGALLFGQVPLLQCPDGLRVVQSQAIVRHVAAQAGLLGASATERALADQMAEGVADFRGPLLSFPFGRDRGACAAAVRRYAPVFERALRGAPAGHVAGGAGHTYADVLLAEAVTGYAELLGDFTREAFPLLGAHRDRVCKLPGARARRARARAAAALTRVRRTWRRGSGVSVFGAALSDAGRRGG